MRPDPQVVRRKDKSWLIWKTKHFTDDFSWLAVSVGEQGGAGIGIGATSGAKRRPAACVRGCRRRIREGRPE